MTGQPAFSLDQQLLYLVVANPVMLAVVEDGNQDVKVGEQFGQRGCLADSHGKVWAFSPFGKPLIQRGTHSIHRVTQRLENSMQKPLAAPYRQHVEPGAEGNGRRR